MKKHRGLIIFLIVIAVIVLIAAITIPMNRAKAYKQDKSQVTADFSTLSSALEAYKTDWGHYPITASPTTAESFGKNTDMVGDTQIMLELTGAAGANVNSNTAVTLARKTGGISYVGPNKLDGMYDPFLPNDDYFYGSNTTGSDWVLYCEVNSNDYIWISNTNSTLTEASGPPKMPWNGTYTPYTLQPD
jgi:type II secretory pathway pseudopilin PulG